MKFFTRNSGKVFVKKSVESFVKGSDGGSSKFFLAKFCAVFLILFSLSAVAFAEYAIPDSAGVETSEGDIILLDGKLYRMESLTPDNPTATEVTWAARGLSWDFLGILSERQSGRAVWKEKNEREFFNVLGETDGDFSVGDQVRFGVYRHGHVGWTIHEKEGRVGTIQKVFSGGNYWVKTGILSGIALKKSDLQKIETRAEQVDSILDATGAETRVGDRVLVGGLNGTIQELSSVVRLPDGTLRWTACYPGWSSALWSGGAGTCSKGTSEPPFYRSVEAVSGIAVDSFVDLPGEDGQGEVLEVFSGGQLLIQTGFFSKKWVDAAVVRKL